MVWDTIKSEGGKIAKMNSWPSPTNWVTDIEVLVCNQGTWIAQIKLAYAVAAEFFWTSFVPSPREIERKFFTGGYRCGFYLNVKVKSPIEIIWGKNTSTVIAQISEPFARALFFWWVQQTAMGALTAWTTVIFPELFCEDAIGDGLRRNDHGALGQGFTSGTPGLGTLVFDRLGLLSPTSALVLLPPGYFTVYAAWFVHPNNHVTEDLQLGFGIDGVAWRLSNPKPTTAGEPFSYISREEGELPTGGAVGAWMQGTRPIGTLPGLVDCVMFTYTWTPFPPTPWPSNLQLPNGPAGPRIPPRCEESPL